LQRLQERAVFITGQPQSLLAETTPAAPHCQHLAKCKAGVLVNKKVLICPSKRKKNTHKCVILGFVMPNITTGYISS